MHLTESGFCATEQVKTALVNVVKQLTFYSFYKKDE